MGDYDILEEIGRGGMGVVYRARQRTLDRIVALKVLPLASLADSRQLTRFHNEARAAATLKHPHIVPAYSAGTERGVHYYSMQYIAGPTLAQMLELLRVDESPKHADSEHDGVLQHARRLGQVASSILNDHRSSRATYCRTLAGWGWQVAEALSNAHQHGIVHRDVKPGNLLLDEAGNVLITDFGLARLELGATITSSGAVVGTWRYMSPEQAAGNNLIVDHRTDIYSLGVTLYEALTLKPAFAGDSRGELVQQIAASNPPTPRSIDATIPVDLETIVLKAMQKEPRDRYLTAADLADDLRRFLDGQPIHARRVSTLRRWRYGVRRHSELAFGVAVALLLTLSLSVAAVWIGRGATGRRSPPSPVRRPRCKARTKRPG